MAMKLLLKLFITASLIFSYALSQAQIPDTQSSLGISYVSGGVGEEESKAMLAEAMQWPLMLELSQLEGGRGIWIFGTAIKILNAKKKLIFDAQAEGPYILINLNAGDYLIEATYEGVVQKRSIHIKSDESQKMSIFWK
jgi:hypothetical protein